MAPSSRGNTNLTKNCSKRLAKWLSNPRCSCVACLTAAISVRPGLRFAARFAWSNFTASTHEFSTIALLRSPVSKASRQSRGNSMCATSPRSSMMRVVSLLAWASTTRTCSSTSVTFVRTSKMIASNRFTYYDASISVRLRNQVAQPGGVQKGIPQAECEFCREGKAREHRPENAGGMTGRSKEHAGSIRCANCLLLDDIKRLDCVINVLNQHCCLAVRRENGVHVFCLEPLQRFG